MCARLNDQLVCLFSGANHALYHIPYVNSEYIVAQYHHLYLLRSDAHQYQYLLGRKAKGVYKYSYSLEPI